MRAFLVRLGEHLEEYFFKPLYFIAIYLVALVIFLMVGGSWMLAPNYIAGMSLAQFMAKMLVPITLVWVTYALVKLVEFLINEATKKKPEEPAVRDAAEFSRLLYGQIDRCNEAGSTNETGDFENCVTVLFEMIPSSVRAAVVRRAEEYKKTTEKPVFKYVAGMPMGTIENPVKSDDGTVISPVMEKSEYVDFRMLFNVVMMELENAGITWKWEGGRLV